MLINYYSNEMTNNDRLLTHTSIMYWYRSVGWNVIVLIILQTRLRGDEEGKGAKGRVFSLNRKVGTGKM